MRIKRKIIKITALILAGILFTGCNAGTKGAEGDKDAKSPITLDWYINFSWFITGWGENLVSKTITDETGVSVNFITPIGSEEEKLNALISSDSLPDIITLGWWEPQVEEMINKGMVYALNELADEYQTDFYEMADENVINWYKQEDGNIYCYPNSSYTPKDVEDNEDIPANLTFLVRKDIYEAIGSPDMTTKEGFYNAIKDAAALYPEIKGEPIIPIGGTTFTESGCASFDQYLQDFLAIPHEVDGKYYDRNMDPEYLDWLKLLRKLNEEGYLPADIFVDQRTQISEKVADGRYFCLIYQRTDLADQQKLLYAENPDSIYMAVDGPRNSRGDAPRLSTAGITGWTVTMISKNCKDPERAIRFMEYLMSEHGQKLVSIGVEGETYDIVDGEVVIKDDVWEILNSDRQKYDELYGADDTYWMLQNNVMQMKWMPKLEEPLKQLAEWTYPYSCYQGQYEVMLVESSEIGEAYSKVKKLWGETQRKLILCGSDEEFDEIVEDYLEKRELIGYREVYEEENRQMNLNKQKLGMN